MINFSKSLMIPMEVIRSSKLKDTMQWPKEKKTNNDLQNTTQKTKDRAKQSPTGVNSGASEG
jgi:hypothetical protein